MKWLCVIMGVLFVALQYRLWIGDGSLAELSDLEHEIAKQRAHNEQLMERNRLLAAEVAALKNSDEALEERARTDLGMIKKGETFFMVVDSD